MSKEEKKDILTKYEWERKNGRTEKFKNAREVVRRILEVNKEARNNDAVLQHIFWTEVQGLDLNERKNYTDKAVNHNTIKRHRQRIQNNDHEFFPTDPEVIYKRCRLGNFTAEHVSEYYKFKNPTVIENFLDYINRRVEDGDITEEEAEKYFLFGE